MADPEFLTRQTRHLCIIWPVFTENCMKTRKHSSSMRTAHLLTVEGCVRGCTQGGVPRGVYVQGGVQGVCAPPSWTQRQTPPKTQGQTPPSNPEASILREQND